jgi:hypothetical protein
MEDLAVHAHNIRNNFFDARKRLVDVLPDVLLRTEAHLDPEIHPRRLVSLNEADAKPAKAAKPAAKPVKAAKAPAARKKTK